MCVCVYLCVVCLFVCTWCFKNRLGFNHPCYKMSDTNYEVPHFEASARIIALGSCTQIHYPLFLPYLKKAFRNELLDMEINCQYNEYAVTDNWAGVVLQLGRFDERLTTARCKKYICSDM